MAEPRTVRENANTLSSVQIAEILPHRYPFALVDRVLAASASPATRNSSTATSRHSRSCPAYCCWKHWHRPALWQR